MVSFGVCLLGPLFLRFQISEVALVGGLFHFKPSMQCRLLALSGHFNRSRVCPLLDKSGQSWILARDGLSANDPKRHWLCTAAMVLMPVSAPIKVLV